MQPLITWPPGTVDIVVDVASHDGLQARLDGPGLRDAGLSRREREALQWVASGLISKAIARRMGLSPYTVDMHIAEAKRKLGARTRSEAVSLAVLQSRIFCP